MNHVAKIDDSSGWQGRICTILSQYYNRVSTLAMKAWLARPGHAWSCTCSTGPSPMKHGQSKLPLIKAGTDQTVSTVIQNRHKSTTGVHNCCWLFCYCHKWCAGRQRLAELNT